MDIYNKESIRKLLEVVENDEVTSKEVKFKMDNIDIRFNLKENKEEEYEAYIVATPTKNKNIEKAVQKLKELRDEFAYHNDKNKNISRQRDNKWAEMNIMIDIDNIKNL